MFFVEKKLFICNVRTDIKASRVFSRLANILNGRVRDMTCNLGISRRRKKRINFAPLWEPFGISNY